MMRRTLLPRPGERHGCQTPGWGVGFPSENSLGHWQKALRQAAGRRKGDFSVGGGSGDLEVNIVPSKRLEEKKGFDPQAGLGDN